MDSCRLRCHCRTGSRTLLEEMACFCCRKEHALQPLPPVCALDVIRLLALLMGATHCIRIEAVEEARSAQL